MCSKAALAFTILITASPLQGAESDRSSTYRAADWPASHAKCQPVPLTETKVSGYLGKRIDRNPASILLALESPIPKGFEAAVTGSKPPKSRLAADSDLYKWLEGACYTFARSKDPEIPGNTRNASWGKHAPRLP